MTQERSDNKRGKEVAARFSSGHWVRILTYDQDEREQDGSYHWQQCKAGIAEGVCEKWSRNILRQILDSSDSIMLQ